MHSPPFAPPQLPRPGDTLRVIAPSGPFDRTLFWRGLGFLAQTFRLKLGAHVFHRNGFLAGGQAERLSDLEAALLCPDSSLVVCARGGVGSSDLIDALATTLRQAFRPKWVVGFSDITTIHAALQSNGWMSVHGPNVTSLGIGNAALRTAFLKHVLAPLDTHTVHLSPLCLGDVSGPLIGGNLTVLHDLCAARAWRPVEGAILFLEEVAEPPYRIYRMLSAMARGGYLQDVKGVVVGQVTHSNPGHHGTTARQVFQQLCTSWSLPAAWGLPSGHDPVVNQPLTLGANARLTVKSSGATLTLNAPP